MADVEDIIKWIVFQCREKGHPVAESFAAYIAYTTVNPSTDRFFLEDSITSDADAKKLVELSVQRLSHSESPSMETLKLQISYDSSYVQQETFQQHFASVQSQETNSYIDEIVNCETRSGNDFEGITLLYKRIFSFLLYRNKLVGLNFANIIIKPGGGLTSLATISNAVVNPNINSNILSTMEREVAAALESVLPRPGLRPFVAMSTPEKVSQLMELSNIVIGIRLYNKETGKGGVGLESFEQLVSHPSRELINQINREVISTVELCEDLTVFLKENYLNSDVKDKLTHRRQFLTYLVALQEDVQNAEMVIEGLHSRYIRELVELKELIGNKTSIPKDQVYPKFDNLCQIYNSMNEEKNKSILRKELFNILIEHKNKVEVYVTKDQISDIKRRAPPSPELVEASLPGANGVIRLTSENAPDFMHLPLDFQGFCIWSIVRRDGLLVPGKPTLGVLKFRERHFVFSSPAGMAEFMENPNFFLDECSKIARNKPQIIHLLRMTEEFPKCSLTHLLQGKDGTPLFSVTAPLMLDQGQETPLHFVESNIDTNYHWNEWELRRKALQMSNIRKKQTSGAQTDLSNFKRDGETQVYLPKDSTTQTMQSKWTDMDWTLNRMYPK